MSLARIFRETDGERRLSDLLFKEIFLVEKENDRRVRKPLVVADRVKQLEALRHTILQNFTEAILYFLSRPYMHGQVTLTFTAW